MRAGVRISGCVILCWLVCTFIVYVIELCARADLHVPSSAWYAQSKALHFNGGMGNGVTRTADNRRNVEMGNVERRTAEWVRGLRRDGMLTKCVTHVALQILCFVLVVYAYVSAFFSDTGLRHTHTHALREKRSSCQLSP